MAGNRTNEMNKQQRILTQREKYSPPTYRFFVIFAYFWQLV